MVHPLICQIHYPRSSVMLSSLYTPNHKQESNWCVFLLPLSYFSSISNRFWLFYFFLRVYIYAFKYMYISYYMISFPHGVDFVDDTLIVQALYFLQIGSWTQRLDQTHAPPLWQDYWWCHVLKRGTYNAWLSFFFFSWCC